MAPYYPPKPPGVDKYTADYNLTDLLDQIKNSQYLIAKPAQEGIADLGLTTRQAVDALLLAETQGTYYKSVPCKWDEKTWQDVYHLETPVGQAYVKMYTELDQGNPPKWKVVIVSYKPL